MKLLFVELGLLYFVHFAAYIGSLEITMEKENGPIWEQEERKKPKPNTNYTYRVRQFY